MEKSNQANQMNKIIEKSVQKDKTFKNAYCFEPWYLITIRANGIVGSCRLFGDKGVAIHNKSLKEIWFGNYYNKIRKQLIEHKLPDYCAKCGANEFIENQNIRKSIDTSHL